MVSQLLVLSAFVALIFTTLGAGLAELDFLLSMLHLPQYQSQKAPMTPHSRISELGLGMAWRGRFFLHFEASPYSLSARKAHQPLKWMGRVILGPETSGRGHKAVLMDAKFLTPDLPSLIRRFAVYQGGDLLEGLDFMTPASQ